MTIPAEKTTVRSQVWILEDDPGCQFVYREVLEEDYDLVFFTRISEFQSHWSTEVADRPKLVIADLKLEDGNFLEQFLSSPEGRAQAKRFLVVTGMEDLEVLRRCGSDVADFITKPFNKGELLVKVEKVIESDVPSTNSSSPFGIEIDPISMIISRVGFSSIKLTSKEQQIVKRLMDSGETPVPRQELCEQVWGKVAVGNKTLDVHVSNLRKKINGLGLTVEFVVRTLFVSITPQIIDSLKLVRDAIAEIKREGLFHGSIS